MGDVSLASFLRSENERLKQELLTFDSLQETNQRLNRELDECRAALKKQASELRKSTGSLTSQLNAVQEEKQELSRRFFNLTEDCKEIKNDLDRMNRQRQDTLVQNESLTAKLQKERAESSAKEKSILLELDRVQSITKDTARQAETQREQDQQQIEGLREAVNVLRGELATVEEERMRFKEEAGRLREDMEAEKHTAEDEKGKQHEQLEESKRELEQAMFRSREERGKLQDRIDNMTVELTSIKSARDAEGERLVAVSAELDLVKKGSKEELKKYKAVIASLEQQHRDAAEHSEELKSTINILTAQHANSIDEAKKGMEAMATEKGQLQNLCDGLQKELELRLTELSSVQKKAEGLSADGAKLRNDIRIAADEQQRRETLQERERTNLNDRVKELEIKHGCLSQDKMDLLRANERLEVELKKTAESEARRVEEVRREYNPKVTNLERELMAVSKKCGTLTEEIEQISALRQEESARALQERQTMSKELDNKEKEVEKIKVELAESANMLEAKTRQAINEKERLQDETTKFQEEHTNIQKTFQCQLDDLQIAQAKNLEDEKSRHAKELLAKVAAIKALESEMMSTTKVNEKLQASLTAARSDIDAREKEQCDTKMQILTLRGEVARANEQLAGLKQKLQESREEEEENSKRTKQMKVRVSEAELSNARLSEEMENKSSLFQVKIEDLEDVVREREDAVDILERNLVDAHDAYAKQRGSLQAVADNLSIELRIAKEAHTREADRKEKELNILRTRLLGCEKEKEAATEKQKGSILALQQELDSCNRQVHQLETEKDGLWVQVEAKSKEADRLSAELCTLRKSAATRERKQTIRRSSLLPHRYKSTSSSSKSKSEKNLASATSQKKTDDSTKETEHDDGLTNRSGHACFEEDTILTKDRTLSRQDCFDDLSESANWPHHSEQSGIVAASSGDEFSPVGINEANGVIDQTAIFLARRRKPRRSSPNRDSHTKSLESNLTSCTPEKRDSDQLQRKEETKFPPIDPS